MKSFFFDFLNFVQSRTNIAFLRLFYYYISINFYNQGVNLWQEQYKNL